jgi:hypothetical protein
MFYCQEKVFLGTQYKDNEFREIIEHTKASAILPQDINQVVILANKSSITLFIKVFFWNWGRLLCSRVA